MSARITLLLGSGVSYGAGMPGMKELTNLVLREKLCTIKRTRDEHYAFHWKGSAIPEHLEAIIEFLRVLQETIRCYKKQRLAFLKSSVGGRVNARAPTIQPENVDYEELFYLAAGIRESTIGQLENPLLELAQGELWTRFEMSGHYYDKFFSHFGYTKMTPMERLGKLSHEATNYIHDLITQKLRDTEKQITISTLKNTYRIIDEIIEFQDRIDVFTLNHDLLLEKRYGNHIEDGFRSMEKHLPHVFNYTNYSPTATQKRIHMYKLHGSIDWYRLRKRGAKNVKRLTERLFKIQISTSRRFGGWMVSENRDQLSLDTSAGLRRIWNPQLLIGRYDKLHQYARFLFSHLLQMFRNRLSESTILIVGGYGFGDKGINDALIAWLHHANLGKHKKKLVIINNKTASAVFSGIVDDPELWEGFRRKNKFIVCNTRFSHAHRSKHIKKLLSNSR